jgi:superfamily II DNA/RNA helicase
MKIQNPEISSALNKLQIRELNEIQQASIEACGKNSDIILLAPTGSGKTLAFLLPVLLSLSKEPGKVQSLILAPTRELALQITQVFKTMGSGFKTDCFYGGHPFKREKDTLNHPPSVLIGTPGRIADHLRRNTFSTEHIHTLVLDEFDKSLDLGFEEDMKFIIGQIPSLKKRILTSATRMEKIPDFTGVTNQTELNYLHEIKTHAGLKTRFVRAKGDDKLQLLFHLLCMTGNSLTLVFCNHRDAVDRISRLLSEKGIDHDTFHGGLEQEDRERALAKFRNGSYRILLCTDLAARGLDIPEIENVIHYQLPPTPESFVHRNGRTARMYAEGTAYLVLAESDYLPEYLTEVPEEITVPENLPVPANPEWITMYIGGGKKHKISKGDIVGLLLQKGSLNKEDVGMIEIQDLSSYVAVNRQKARKAVQLLRDEKLKKQKVKIDISK